MNFEIKLKIDWCSFEASKYACENWHYSKCLPVGKTVKVGAWEDDKYIGCVLFSRGANANIGKPYGLEQTECVELTRIALTSHVSPVSQIMAVAIKFLMKENPGLHLIVSYADPEEGHHGGIYQATNWIYVGLSGSSEKVFYNGRWVHKRTVDSVYGHHKGFPIKKTSGKHTYLFPLNKKIKKQILPLSAPYPKKLTPEAK